MVPRVLLAATVHVVPTNLFSIILYIYRIIFLAVPLICSIANAQIDTTLKDYFPVHIGDIWEYEIDEFPYPHFQVEIIEDTVMANSQTYFNFDGIGGGFYRISDSLCVYRYSPEYVNCIDSEAVVYDLTLLDRGVSQTCLPTSDGSIGYIGLDFTFLFSYSRLGVIAETKQFCEAQVDTVATDTLFCPIVPNINYIPQRLAKGLGLVWSQSEGPATILVGAIIDSVQFGDVTSIRTENVQPMIVNLEQNYPNPFNPNTFVEYEIGNEASVVIGIYDIHGKKVRTLLDSRQDVGKHRIEWDARDDRGSRVSTGVYILRMKAEDTILWRKVVLLK